MKKLFFTALTFLCVSISFSQWKMRSVDNGFDEPYKIALTAKNNGSFLKLENVEGDIFFYIQEGYFCDEEPLVELVFVVNGQNVKYSIYASNNSEGDCVFFCTDLMNNEMLNAFKKCSSVKIRINQDYCDTYVYTFNMSQSTSALNFVINQ
jgi:hypothetical protein